MMNEESVTTQGSGGPINRNRESAMNAAHNEYRVNRWIDGAGVAAWDCVAEEIPVALAYNGIAHAVMLATPRDIEDFAVGFSLSEGIVGRAGEIHDLEVSEHANGLEVQLVVGGDRARALKERRRTLAGRTGCGLCGVESLDRFRAEIGVVHSSVELAADVLALAQIRLAEMQQLFHLTGAVHAAAWCNPAGGVEFLREDVGRHNALDKVIGAMASGRHSFGDGFLLLTSRASYEMVQKAAAVGIAIVAAVSAPTGMAVRTAEFAGVTLIGFTRGDRHSIYSHPERVH